MTVSPCFRGADPSIGLKLLFLLLTITPKPLFSSFSALAHVYL